MPGQRPFAPAARPTALPPLFAGILGELDQCSGLDAIQCPNGHCLFGCKPETYMAIEQFRTGSNSTSESTGPVVARAGMTVLGPGRSPARAAPPNMIGP